jgi:hypothetical protein
LVQKRKKKLNVNSLSDFSEHSSQSFLDEVLGVVKQVCSKGKEVGMFPSFDEVESGENSNSPVSKRVGLGELEQDRAVFIEVVLPYDFGCRKVDEVSIIDESGVVKVELDNFV